MLDKIVHLIDDDEGVREALTVLLTEAGYAVRSYKSGLDFLAIFDPKAPGCIVSDIRMPGLDGLELQQRLRALNITLPLIFITGHGDIQMAVQAIRGGASDFIEKPFDEALLIGALEREFSQTAQSIRPGEHDDIRRKLEGLTPRERQVLDCMVDGKPNKVTAFELGLSIRTVETHRAHVMQKMDVASLSELVRQVIAVR
ncbi:MAG: response regulator [Proteobacteria bacterium]|nr:response regulator [Pseudomonadota bacterium]